MLHASAPNSTRYTATRELARQIRLNAAREETARWFARQSADTRRKLLTCWQLSAHEPQLRPTDAGRPIWLFVAGRGSGKTRAAAEDELDAAEDRGAAFVGQLVSKTFSDVKRVQIEGESGLMACAHRRGYSLDFQIGNQRVVHPNGATWQMFSAEKPDAPRGSQCNSAWLDEIAAWPETKAIECFDNVMFAWRLPGAAPRMTITTTPKPNPIMFRLLRSDALRNRIAITRDTTHSNRANLNPDAYATMCELYEGTSIGRQEMLGELLELAGPIVTQDVIHAHRVRHAAPLGQIVVSVDPAVTSKKDSDATGIIVVGADMQRPAHVYVLDDRTQQRAKWAEWGRAVVLAFDEWGAAKVIAEVNQGGEGIEEQIHESAEAYSAEVGREVVVPVVNVWAKQSKKARAEPVGALYERGRVHHVGELRQLEKELTNWVPGMPSPDRMDALVHGVWHLLLTGLGGVEGPIARYLLRDDFAKAA